MSHPNVRRRWGALALAGALLSAAVAYAAGFTSIQDATNLGNALTINSDGSAKVSVQSVTGTLTSRSSTITSGGTSQQVAAANTSRKYLFVQNPCSETEDLYIRFTSAATANQNSIDLRPCAAFTMESSFVSTEAVNVIAATTAHTFTALEGQ